MKKQMVEKIYRENENRTDKGIDEMVITEALGVATEECDNRPIERLGIRLQRIPVELFDLALAS